MTPDSGATDWPTSLTLILTVISPDVVVQIADRRFVTTTTFGDVTWVDDEKNKSILWRTRYTAAFAGLADLGERGRTDLWLAHQLHEIEQQAESAGGDLDSVTGGPFDLAWAFHELADRATAEMAREPNARLDRESKSQWFVISGWANHDGSLQPFCARITNTHDETRNEFVARCNFLEPGSGGDFGAVGRPIDDADEFLQQLAAVTAAFGFKGLIDGMVDKIRSIAKFDQLVGRGMLISIIPKKAVDGTDAGHPNWIMEGYISPTAASFHQLPADDSTTFRYNGVTIVGHGGGIVSDLSTEPLPRPDSP